MGNMGTAWEETLVPWKLTVPHLGGAEDLEGPESHAGDLELCLEAKRDGLRVVSMTILVLQKDLERSVEGHRSALLEVLRTEGNVQGWDPLGETHRKRKWEGERGAHSTASLTSTLPMPGPTGHCSGPGTMSESHRTVVRCVLSFPFHRWGNRSPGRLRKLPQLTTAS